METTAALVLTPTEVQGMVEACLEGMAAASGATLDSEADMEWEACSEEASGAADLEALGTDTTQWEVEMWKTGAS